MLVHLKTTPKLKWCHFNLVMRDNITINDSSNMSNHRIFLNVFFFSAWKQKIHSYFINGWSFRRCCGSPVKNEPNVNTMKNSFNVNMLNVCVCFFFFNVVVGHFDKNDQQKQTVQLTDRKLLRKHTQPKRICCATEK